MFDTIAMIFGVIWLICVLLFTFFIEDYIEDEDISLESLFKREAGEIIEEGMDAMDGLVIPLKYIVVYGVSAFIIAVWLGWWLITFKWLVKRGWRTPQ